MNLTRDSGPTVNSDYLEPSHPQAAFIVRLFKFFRIRLRMKVDHIFVDTNTANTHISVSRVLNDRVSDHSPLELILKPGFQAEFDKRI